MPVLVPVLVAMVVMILTAPARADGPIIDRDYAIDFYEGVAIGNTAWSAWAVRARP